MDKTDYCVSNYLDGKTTQARNRRKTIDGAPMFPKLKTPRETNYLSRGCGVVHDGKQGLSWRAYQRKRIAHCVRRYDENVGEVTLIARGDYTPRVNTAKPSNAKW